MDNLYSNSGHDPGSYYDLVESLQKQIDEWVSESDDESLKIKSEKLKGCLHLAGQLADLQILVEVYESGHKEHLPFILSFCFEHKLEVPPQIVSAIYTAASKLEQRAINPSLDEAFGYLPGQKNELKAFEVYELGVLMKHQKPKTPINIDGLFTDISEFYGGKLTPSQVSNLYYDGKKNYELFCLAKLKSNLDHSLLAFQILNKLTFEPPY